MLLATMVAGILVGVLLSLPAWRGAGVVKEAPHTHTPLPPRLIIAQRRRLSYGKFISSIGAWRHGMCLLHRAFPLSEDVQHYEEAGRALIRKRRKKKHQIKEK